MLTGCARISMLALLQACPMCRRGGISDRVADPEASAPSARPGFLRLSDGLLGHKNAGRWPNGAETRRPASHAHVRGATGSRNPTAQRIPRYRRLRRSPIWLCAARLTVARNAGRRPGGHESRCQPPPMYVRRPAGSAAPSGPRIPKYPGFRPQPDSIPYQTASRGETCRSAAGRARNSIRGLVPACTRRDELGKSIRVADPEVSALSAQPR